MCTRYGLWACGVGKDGLNILIFTMSLRTILYFLPVCLIEGYILLKDTLSNSSISRSNLSIGTIVWTIVYFSRYLSLEYLLELSHVRHMRFLAADNVFSIPTYDNRCGHQLPTSVHSL